MKSFEELISRFNDIEDLPVSEEILGAYKEGTLQGEELYETSKLISSNPYLSEILNDVTDSHVEDFTGMDDSWDNFDGNYGYSELSIPPVLSSNDVPQDNIENNIDDISLDGDRIQAEETLSLQNTENNPGANVSNLNVMANDSKTIIYGESGENKSDPVFIQQPDDHSCALRSQQIVLRDFGIDIPFKDLEQIALDSNVYTNEGTYTYDIGKVLQLAGVGMHQTVGNTVDDLINELSQGHRVIVSVDAYELWYNKSMGDRLLNWFNDAIGNQGGNHALIVAGVEVNPTHPENSKVILTDPGAGHLRIEYPMEQFKEAWGDSNCFMAATDAPAPYQYDSETGMEVPSNFAMQQYINDFVANNSYQLSPDMINVPQDFKPIYDGHLDVVGDVDYNTFKTDYDDMVARRLPSSLSVKEQIEEIARMHEEKGPLNINELETLSRQSSSDCSEMPNKVSDELDSILSKDDEGDIELEVDEEDADDEDGENGDSDDDEEDADDEDGADDDEE